MEITFNTKTIVGLLQIITDMVDHPDIPAEIGEEMLDRTYTLLKEDPDFKSWVESGEIRRVKQLKS